MVWMVEFSEIVLRVTPVQEPLITYICHVVCSWIVFGVFKASLMYLNPPVSSRATKTTIDIKGCMFSHIFPYDSIRKYVFLWFCANSLACHAGYCAKCQLHCHSYKLLLNCRSSIITDYARKIECYAFQPHSWNHDFMLKIMLGWRGYAL